MVDTIAPEVTGLSDDDVAAKSKTWNWGCNEASCEYRHEVTQSSTHTWGAETFGANTQRVQDSGDGEYYLHVQARDKAGNESRPDKARAVLDNTGPRQQGEVTVGDSNKIYLHGEEMVFTVTYDENVIVDTSGGTPALMVEIGGNLLEAPYRGGSGSDQLSFVYVVGAVTDTNGLRGGDQIRPNSGTLRDAVGNDAVVNGLAAENWDDVRVDGVAPTLDGVGGTDKTYALSATVELTAEFSEEVRVDNSQGNTLSGFCRWAMTRYWPATKARGMPTTSCCFTTR